MKKNKDVDIGQVWSEDGQTESRTAGDFEMNDSDFDKAVSKMIEAKGYAYTLGFLQSQFKVVVQHQVAKTRQNKTLAETARVIEDAVFRY